MPFIVSVGISRRNATEQEFLCASVVKRIVRTLTLKERVEWQTDSLSEP
jgi:hypothetical protein